MVISKMNPILIITEEKLQLQEKVYDRIQSYEKKKKEFMEKTKKLRLLINSYKHMIKLKELELDKAILKEFGKGRSFSCYNKILKNKEEKLNKERG